MRKNGLEVVAAQPAKRAGNTSLGRKVAMGALAVSAIAGGVAYWTMRTPNTLEGDAPVADLDEATLAAYLRGAGIDVEPWSRLLAPGDSVRALFPSASKSSAASAPEAVMGVIDARFEKKAIERWSLDGPIASRPRPAVEVAKIIARDGVGAKLVPLELAALAVSALRDQGVPAAVAEIWGLEGQKTPPDPTGRVGYFGAAVFAQEVGKGDAKVYDTYSGRARRATEFRVLSDTQAVAAALNIKALRALQRDRDVAGALRDVDRALKLDGRSPYIRTVRAMALLTSGNAEEGGKELEAAAQIRPDPPRYNNLAALRLAKNEPEQAARDVDRALAEAPEFAAAHATRASVHLAKGETEVARQKLVTVERLDRRLGNLPLLWAEYHLRVGDPEAAVEQVQRALRKRPRDWQVRLAAARVYRAASRFDDMRRAAQEAIELVPETQRDVMREQIEQMLGPSAFDEPSEEDGEDWEDSDLAGDLDLGGGAGASGSSGPSLLDEELGSDLGGPALQLGDPSKLRLRDPDTKLRLDLSE